MNRITIITFLLFVVSPAMAYQSQLSGSLQFSGGQMFDPVTPDITDQTLSLEPHFQSEMELEKSFHFNFDVWSKYDPVNKSSSDIFQLELDEFSLSSIQGGRRIKFGQSYRNWEGTDLINPMDILFSKNWIDPLNGRMRSGLGFFYDNSFGDFSLDFTYLIRQQEPLLPGSKSAWWPRGFYLPTESDDLILRLGGKIDYEIEDSEVFDHALDNNVGLRLQYHGTNIDLSLAGAEGLATPPLLLPIIDVAPIEVSPRKIYELQSPIRIQPILYRQRSIAGTLVWTLKDVIFRFSANHVQPLGNHPELPGWSELGVFGVEKTFYFGNQMVTLLGQFIDSRRPDSSGVSLLTSLYQESYMLGTRYAPTDKWTFFLAWFQETKTWSSFSHGEMTWSFSPGWSLGIEANVFEGPASSAIGTYNKNDSGYAHIKYSF